MSETVITIPTDAAKARRFQAAPPVQQQQLVLLVNQWLAALDADETLEELMERVSRTAQAKGMTPEVLQDILDAPDA